MLTLPKPLITPRLQRDSLSSSFYSFLLSHFAFVSKTQNRKHTGKTNECSINSRLINSVGSIADSQSASRVQGSDKVRILNFQIRFLESVIRHPAKLLTVSRMWIYAVYRVWVSSSWRGTTKIPELGVKTEGLVLGLFWMNLFISNVCD